MPNLKLRVSEAVEVDYYAPWKTIRLGKVYLEPEMEYDCLTVGDDRVEMLDVLSDTILLMTDLDQLVREQKLTITPV